MVSCIISFYVSLGSIVKLWEAAGALSITGMYCRRQQLFGYIPPFLLFLVVLYPFPSPLHTFPSAISYLPYSSPSCSSLLLCCPAMFPCAPRQSSFFLSCRSLFFLLTDTVCYSFNLCVAGERPSPPPYPGLASHLEVIVIL